MRGGGEEIEPRKLMTSSENKTRVYCTLGIVLLLHFAPVIGKTYHSALVRLLQSSTLQQVKAKPNRFPAFPSLTPCQTKYATYQVESCHFLATISLPSPVRVDSLRAAGWVHPWTSRDTRLIVVWLVEEEKNVLIFLFCCTKW